MKALWNANKCCHAGICVKPLPEVFKIESVIRQRPFDALAFMERSYESSTNKIIIKSERKI